MAAQAQSKRAGLAPLRSKAEARPGVHALARATALTATHVAVRLDKKNAPISPPYSFTSPHISPISPPHLPYISPISPIYLREGTVLLPGELRDAARLLLGDLPPPIQHLP